MECRLKAKKCGGCPMLGLDYAEQLKQKEAAVRKLVGKYGPVAPIRGAENPCHYRNKVISTFAAGPGGKLVSGIYAAGTHKVLPVESCLLQDEVLDTVMQAVRAAASTCRYQPYNEDKGIGLLRHCLLRRGVVSGPAESFFSPRSGLWRRQVLPAPFPAGPPAGQAVPHGGPALPPAGSGSFLPWWYPPAFFLPVYHRIVTEKTPPAKSGLIPPADLPPHPSAETDRAGTRYSARPGEGPAPGQRRHLR